MTTERDSVLRLAPRWEPKRMPYDEIEALPLADEDTRGCPNCGGRHYSAVHPLSRYAPGYYRCNGTEWPNADGHEYRPACGALFRGRPDVHYDAEWFAAMTAIEFIRRFSVEGAPVDA